MHPPPSPRSTRADAIVGALGLLTALWLAVQAFSLPIPRGAAGDDSRADPPGLEPCVMAGGGYWRGRIFGATVLDIDWRDAVLECAGNARPGERGLRLFLAGRPAAGAERLLLVIGIGAQLPDLAGREHPASITVIDETTSGFFHGSESRCFARIDSVRALPGEGRHWRVEGDLYCAGSIPAVAGPGSVTLGDMRFAVRLSLEES